MKRADWNHMFKLVGLLMEVYNELGRGLSEAIYQEAFEKELISNKIPFVREKDLFVYYKGELLKKYYTADFYSEGVIIEMKATENLTSDNRAQLFNYLRIAKQELGILVNFGERSLHCERYVYDEEIDKYILISKENFSDYITD